MRKYSDGWTDRDFIGYGATPPHPRWPDGKRIALNFVINYEEGSEPSYPDGDGVSEGGLGEGGSPGQGRDLAAESMFEYGSRVGFWRLMRLLTERDVPATIFGCAVALERNPEAVAAIRRADFDTCCHGRRWILHQNLTEDEERSEIAAAVETITKLFGAPPAGWYCRYSPGVNTRRLLVEHGGFLYDSDSYNDELPYWRNMPGGRCHLVVPYSLTTNDGKFSRGAMATADDFFIFCRDTFDMLWDEGATQPKMMSIGLHMRLIGHPGRAAGLARFLDYVLQKPDVWLCRRIDIANHWHAQFPRA